MTNSHNREEIYLQKLVEGDESAFRFFIKTYGDMAITLASSIVKDEFIAQEVAQDAFIKAFKAIGSFNNKSSFKTWFYRIVINEAFYRLKKSKKDLLLFCGTYDDNIADNEDSYNLSESDEIEEVNRILNIMPPNESLALRLFYLESNSIKEVAELTGWTESNTKVILHRARKTMQHCFNNNKQVNAEHGK